MGTKKGSLRPTGFGEEKERPWEKDKCESRQKSSLRGPQGEKTYGTGRGKKMAFKFTKEGGKLFKGGGHCLP